MRGLRSPAKLMRVQLCSKMPKFWARDYLSEVRRKLGKFSHVVMYVG